MDNYIGVMQGRLLPKYLKKYQAHPVGYWADEFSVAREYGLDCIEFIFDYDQATTNPLMTKVGKKEIKNIVSSTEIEVKTVCADYFMDAPLHSKDEKIRQKSFSVLSKLIDSSSELRITDIVLPCVDHSSIRNQYDESRLIEMVQSLVEKLEFCNINLALETELGPRQFAALLAKIDSDRVTVNYDTGNSAALGFDCVEELDAYGEKVTDVHIKDRSLNGGSVELGLGDADFKNIFCHLQKVEYLGPLIMQAYRDDEGLKIFKRQLDWIKPFLGS